jgi:N-acetyl sugar amidotransferase
MDTSDPGIIFDENNVCNYCNTLNPTYQQKHLQHTSDIEKQLQSSANLIKKRAGSNKYHCVLGLSGGVDSSFTADLIVNKLKLNPLIVHFDNGWNSPVAVENIKKIISKLKLDMLTYVIDWDEFKDLQRAFLYASVLDIEMLTDNAIYGSLIKIAKKHNIKCIVSGENFTTESGLPAAWRWEKLDAKNIREIHRLFGDKKLKSFPIYGPIQFLLDRIFSGIYYFYPLNIIQYSKTQAMNLIKNEYNWQYYGGKHYESLFTKFYQAYILPTKFLVDKRRTHLSSLIRNAEITRDTALQELNRPLYETQELIQDKEYILKKLNFSEEEFNQLMLTKPKAHTDYASDLNKLLFIKKAARKFKLKKGAFA